LTEVREDLEAFLRLPERVYAGDPFHIPTRREDVQATLRGAQKFWVALDGGEPVARVAVWRSPALGILGLFEALDGHPDAVAKLFQEAVGWLRQETEMIVGPMDGDTWHRYRVNVGPFDQPPFLSEPYNPPYYEALWTANGFDVLERYYSKRVDPAAVVAFLEEKRNVAGYRLRSLDRSRFREELGTIYELSRRIFARNFLYTEISEGEFLRLYTGAERLIDPELVLFAHAPDGQPVGFLFAYPDRFRAVAAMRGERGLLAGLRYLLNRKTDAVDFKTLGVLPEHRRSGVAAALFHEGHHRAVEKGYRWANHCLFKEGNPSGDLDGGAGSLLRTYHLYRYTPGA
jgi:GNAT superfamily N-acetyltransferase